ENAQRAAAAEKNANSQADAAHQAQLDAENQRADAVQQRANAEAAANDAAQQKEIADANAAEATTQAARANAAAAEAATQRDRAKAAAAEAASQRDRAEAASKALDCALKRSQIDEEQTKVERDEALKITGRLVDLIDRARQAEGDQAASAALVHELANSSVTLIGSGPSADPCELDQ
ncbi:MAG TPA: hypothetical protein VGF22_09415, partial [Acidimicrobiales bacterium]